MFLKIFNQTDGVFKPEFRNQLLASLSVVLITFCHGIGLGWLSPMLVRLQSTSETPLDFSVTVDEASWIGAFVSLGGLIGNLMFYFLVNRTGRKIAIYCLVFPHMLLWITLYFAESVEFLYAARIFGGTTGGGIYVVIPLFIGEIADPIIRGRLTSLFSTALNIGILVGFILSSHVPYHLIPCAVIALPLLFIFLATFYPETPQHLLRHGREKEAKASFKHYRNYKPVNKTDEQQFEAAFSDLKVAIMNQMNESGANSIHDFFNKRAMKAMCTGIILMLLNIYSGTFALTNYMSSIFATTKAELHPDTNTIIIGVVQIIGTYAATILVDRYGRKILMLVSTAGMGLGLAAFGMYAFYAEETNVDLSYFSWWLPLLLMAFIVFIGNVGLVSVTFVLLIEIMPVKIRARAASICLGILSVFAFGILKGFPIFQDVFGLSATMWFCASVCAFGVFYVSMFLEETKGKSMDND